MKHTVVKSTNIKSIAYDPDTLTLEIIFKNGNHYSYDDIPQKIYDELKSAESVGKFFHTNIKGRYPTTKHE